MLPLHFHVLPVDAHASLVQLVFMLGLFGYMNFLIFYKWCINWNSPSAPGAPPNLIDTLISIVLKPGSVTDPMFSGQAGLQVFLLLCIFFAVPTMLLPKPFLLKKQNEERKAALGALLSLLFRPSSSFTLCFVSFSFQLLRARR